MTTEAPSRYVLPVPPSSSVLADPTPCLSPCLSPARCGEVEHEAGSVAARACAEAAPPACGRGPVGPFSEEDLRGLDHEALVDLAPRLLRSDAAAFTDDALLLLSGTTRLVTRTPSPAIESELVARRQRWRLDDD